MMPFSTPEMPMYRRWRAVSDPSSSSPGSTQTHGNTNERKHSTSHPSPSSNKGGRVAGVERQTLLQVSERLKQIDVSAGRKPELNDCSAGEAAVGESGEYQPPLSAPTQDSSTPVHIHPALLEPSRNDSISSTPGFLPQQDVANNLLTMRKEKLQAYAVELTRKHLALVDEVVRQEKKADQLVAVLNELVKQGPDKNYTGTPPESTTSRTAAVTEKKYNSPWRSGAEMTDTDTVCQEGGNKVNREIKYKADQNWNDGTLSNITSSKVDVLSSVNYSDSACAERNIENGISVSDLRSTRSSTIVTIRAEEGGHVCPGPYNQNNTTIAESESKLPAPVPKPIESAGALISTSTNAITAPLSSSVSVPVSVTLKASKDNEKQAITEDPAIKVQEIRRTNSPKAAAIVVGKTSDVKQPVERVPRNNHSPVLPPKRDNYTKKPKRYYNPPQKRGNVMPKKFSPPEDGSRKLNIEFAMDKRNHGGGVLVINAARRRTVYHTYCEPFTPDLLTPNDGGQDTSSRKIWHCANGLRYFKKHFSQGDLIRVHSDERKIIDEGFKPTGKLLDLVKEISKSVGCTVEVFHRHITSVEALHENKQMLGASYLASGRRRDCIRIMETVIGATAASQEKL